MRSTTSALPESVSVLCSPLCVHMTANRRYVKLFHPRSRSRSSQKRCAKITRSSARRCHRSTSRFCSLHSMLPDTIWKCFQMTTKRLLPIGESLFVALTEGENRRIVGRRHAALPERRYVRTGEERIPLHSALKGASYFARQTLLLTHRPLNKRLAPAACGGQPF